MKYLKYILGIIALLGILFIAKGFLIPNITYSSEIVVNKPAKEAWAVMNDESKTAQWLKGIKKQEHVSGEKGQVGGVTKYTFEENGQESIMVETIKALRPNEHIAMDFVMEDVMEMDYQMDTSTKDGKTHIKSSTTVRGLGMFMRSMVSFMEGTMQAQEEENMNNLKVLIEANTTDYFPAPVVCLLYTSPSPRDQRGSRMPSSA